jgi:hypothetical protein
MTQRHAEAHIYGAGDDVLALVRAKMPGLDLTAAPDERGIDVGQIIEIAGNVASIVSGLIAVKVYFWPPQAPEPGPQQITVIVRTEDGEALDLAAASEDEIRKAIEGPDEP